METLNVVCVSSEDIEDCKPSKAEILRGMIAEKLTTAAQEIIAVVERTVAGYEEEAAGFRQEIDRQRKQLEVLLQPRVKLSRIGLEDRGGRDVLRHTKEEEGEDDDDMDEEESAEEPAWSSSPEEDRISNTSFQSQSGMRRQGVNYLRIRICLLKASTSNLLSRVARTSMHELVCPHDLQEADFLDLLRSRFPQLTGPIDAFAADASKRLLPLKIAALTPGEIQRSILSTGRGRSALYIRAKHGEEEWTCKTESEHENTADPLSTSTATTTTTTRRARIPLPSSVADSEGEAGDKDVEDDDRDGDWKPDEGDDEESNTKTLVLRVCLLRNIKTKAISSTAFKYPVQKLRCPHGLQEADFLDLLRSRFPQLTGPIDAFITDASRKLFPLKVTALTPEEIQRSIQFTGRGRSALYIRAKGVQGDELDEDWKPNEGDDDKESNTKTVLLRVSLLRNIETNVISKTAFECPVQKLRCPHGLQEADFLDLLRSRFPQLTGPIDAFITDTSRKLLPLKVTALTPEEIQRSIQFTGRGKSALYIRAKGGDGERTCKKEREDKNTADPLSASTTTGRALIPSPSSAADSKSDAGHKGVQDDDRDDDWKPDEGDDEDSNTKTVLFRVCLLRNTETSVVSPMASKYPVQKLRCPHGLQEADFLDLLRSRFPQLTGPFDAFATDASKRLLPLKVTALTPEEIQRSIQFTGRGRSALYIRAKVGDKEKKREKERQHENTADSLTGITKHYGDEDHYTITGHPLQLRVCLLRNIQTNVLSTKICKHPVQKLRCPDGLREADFLELLRSRFPDLPAGDGLIDFFLANKSKKLQPLRLKTLTPENILRSIKLTGKGRSALYIRPKAGEKFLTSKEQRHKASSESLSTASSLTGSDEARPHASSHNGADSRQEGDDGEDCGISEMDIALSPARPAAEREGDNDDEHVKDKPQKGDVCHKSFGFPRELRVHNRSRAGDKPYRCDVCGKSMRYLPSFTRHMLRHTGEKRHGCKVCGKCFFSPGNLKEHEKIHTDGSNSHLCGICRQMFRTLAQLNTHLETHDKPRLYLCSKCGRKLPSRSALQRHVRIHHGERPYRCYKCGQTFACWKTLRSHLRTHSGSKLLDCGICGKTCAKPEYLKVHMRTHTGERPYKCPLCDKAFARSHRRKTHMKSHQTEEKSAAGGLMLS